MFSNQVQEMGYLNLLPILTDYEEGQVVHLTFLQAIQA